MAVEHVTDANFDEKVIQEKTKPVLVDYWAEWCGPCRMLAPVIEAISEKHTNSLAVYKLNTDESPTTAQTHEITSIPCCILFNKGEEVHRIVGFKSQDAFEAELKDHLS